MPRTSQYANPVVVTAATTTTVFGYSASNPTFTGALTGSGTIYVKSDRGTLGNLMINGDISGFTGTLSFDNSGNGVNFQYKGTTAASRDGSQAHFVTSGATSGGPGAWLFFVGAGNTFKMGDLAGTGGYIIGVGVGMTFEIGALNTDTTYAGAIRQDAADAVIVAKVGSGTLTLSGANSYTGATTVSNGILAVSNTTGSGTGSGAVTVKTTATLAGTGSISGSVSVEAGGFVAPGSAGTGTLTVGATTLSGTYQCQLDGASADRLSVTGNLALGGATLALSPLTTPSALGYVIASYTGTLSGSFASVTGMPAGYELQYDATAKQIKLVQFGYAAWTLGTFAQPFTDTATASDPDNDGLSNLMEYAFGIDPTVSSPGLIAYTGAVVNAHGRPTTLAENGRYYAVFGRRTDHVAAGLTYTVQFSATMAEGEWTDGSATPTQIASDGVIDVMKVPYQNLIITPRGAEKPTFFRMKVTQNP